MRLNNFGKKMRAEIGLNQDASMLEPRARLGVNRRSALKRRSHAVSNAVQPLEKRVLYAAFQPGDLVVYRVGSGTSALTATSTAVYLDEYTPTGTLVQSIPLPTASNGSSSALTAMGSGTNEGSLTLSADGQSLYLTGYNAVPGVAGVSGANSSTPAISGTISSTTTGNQSLGTPVIATLNNTYGMANGQQITITGVGATTNISGGTYYLQLNYTAGTISAITKVALYNNYSAGVFSNPVVASANNTSTGIWTDTAIAAVPRVVGVVSASGTVNTTTSLGNAFNSGNIYSAEGATGSGGIYVGGSFVTGTTNQSGLVYTTVGTSATANQLNASTGIYAIQINNGQLYASGSSSSLGFVTVGTGLPTTAGNATLTDLSGTGFSGTSGAGVGYSREFAFATLNPGDTTPDTLYVADSYNDDVDKLSLVNGSWTLNGTIGAYGADGNPLAGISGIAVVPSPSGEQLFITTSTTTTGAGATSKLFTITDPYGYNSVGGSAGTSQGAVFSGSPSLITLATSATNEAFRGMTLVPQPGGAPTVFTQPQSVPQGVNGNPVTFTATASGVNVSTQWYVSNNAGGTYTAIAGATFPTLIVTPVSGASGNNGSLYEAVFTNASGSANSSPATLTVIPGPQLTFTVSATSAPSTYGTLLLDVHRYGDLTGAGAGGTDTVQYNASGGTAVNGTNYTLAAGTLTFPNDGTTTDEYISVPLHYLATQTATLGFNVNLYNVQGTNAVVGTGTEPVSILVPQEAIGLSNNAYSVDSTNADALVSIIRAGTSSADAGSAPFTITSATGTTISTGTANFSAGQTVVPLEVPLASITGTSFNVSVGAPTGFNISGAILANGSNGAYATTMVSFNTITPASYNLSGTAASVTDIETSGQYLQAFAPVVGDATAGTGSFAQVAYEVLEFSPTTTPGLYPVAGTVVSNTSGMGLSLQLYNTDNSGFTGTADNYSGHVGNFNVYLIQDTDAATATSSLTYATSTTPVATGISTAFSKAPILLGTFSFDNSIQGYQTYTATSLSAAAKNLLAADLNGPNPGTTANAGVPFRLAVTPVQTGLGSIAADWRGVYSGQTPIVSITGTQTAKYDPEFFAFNQSSYSVNETAGVATITLSRSGPFTGDSATVTYNSSGGNAVAGTNYNSVSGTANFAAGSLTTTFNVSITALSPQGGDKYVVLNLSAPIVTSNTGSPALTTFGLLGNQSSATLTILDTSTAPTETLTTTPADAGDIEATGPFDDTNFKAGGSSTAYPSFGAVDLVASNPTLSPNTVTAIDSITLSLTNEADVVQGPIDFYLVADTYTNILPSSPVSKNPHFYNKSAGGEGLGSQFGATYLLGTYNITDTNTGDVITVPLTTFGLAAEEALIGYINTGTEFRIVDTPETAAVNGDFVATSVSASIKVQEATDSSSSTLPSWLAPGSSAIWSPSTGLLEVTGSATIIANPGPGVDITANGTSAVLKVAIAGNNAKVQIQDLTLTNGATANLQASTGAILVTSGLYIDAISTLDLADGYLDYAGGNLSSITNELTIGYNKGLWNGFGIISSTAQNNASHLTTLGVIQNNQSGTALFTAAKTFDGVTPGTTDILVRYTYFGDANLDGKVDGSDYSLIDAAFLNNASTKNTALTGWFNGDFNYDGTINGTDYTLIDNTFNRQGGASPTAQVASPEAMIAKASTLPSHKNGTAVPPMAAATTTASNYFSTRKVKSSLIDQLLQELMGSN